MAIFYFQLQMSTLYRVYVNVNGYMTMIYTYVICYDFEFILMLVFSCNINNFNIQY